MAKNFDQKAIIKEAFQKGAHTVGYGFKEVGGKFTDELAIKIAVRKKGPVPLSMMIHKYYDGTPSDVYESEIPHALEITERFRPAPGGCSCGHYKITAGTLGCWVRNKNGQIVGLSNNHVLANSNDAQIGDVVLQPGSFDGGQNPDDIIAELESFVPIHFLGEETTCRVSRGTVHSLNAVWAATGRQTRFPMAIVPQANFNKVDAAIAKPINVDDVKSDILQIGRITGEVSGDLGMDVQKTGRTTEHTIGKITQVDTISQVQYGAGKIAIFDDQMAVTGDYPFSAGGDSGSAVLTLDNKITGLLFAGSDTMTIVNRIENVFSALGISL